MTDPPDPQRHEAPTRPRILAITSGKGGVGKSSITVNLGITLARQGRRVCVLDADTGLANVNILLGLRPQRGLAEVLAGECAIEDILLEGPHGLRIIPGASGIREYVELDAARQRRLVTELARIERHFDDLLLDTAAGVGETTLDFLAAAHQVLLIITPEPTSLTDAFSLLKLALRRQAVDCRVIVNKVADIAEARGVFQRFSAAVEKYLDTRVLFLGFIQRDESLRSAVSLQHPVALFPEHDPSARPFQRLAHALDDEPGECGTSFSRFWLRRLARPEPVPSADTESDDDPDARSSTPDDVEPSLSSNAEPADVDPLQALHRAFETALREVDDPKALAACLDDLNRAFREHLGAGVDPVAIAGGDDPSVPVVADPATAADESFESWTGPTSPQVPPDFGGAASVAGGPGTEVPDDPGAAAGAEPRSPERPAMVVYDRERFGSQEVLLERLRAVAHDPRPLSEIIRDLGDAPARSP